MTASGGGQEREIKLSVVSISEVRKRLQKLGAEEATPANREENWVFDRKHELRDRGEILRLRRDGSGVRLTYKGPATFDGDVKVREERELGLDDEAEARALLAGLRFEVVKRYEKVREEWRLGDVTVALDRTPLGHFVELEGPAREAEELARRLRLDPARSERRSYLELWEDHRRDHPEAPEDMLFE